VSSVPRHSEEELRQQWAFLDALVDRQAASLKSGIQDPEEDDLTVPMVAGGSDYLVEISTLTERVTTLEDERLTLLRRIDLAEEARVAAESARATAEAARLAAEEALVEERARATAAPVTPPPASPVVGDDAASTRPLPPAPPAAKPRRKSWWQRIRE
jgi:hypothetical protein